MFYYQAAAGDYQYTPPIEFAAHFLDNSFFGESQSTVTELDTLYSRRS